MNLNRVFLLGNVVSDPEARMTASGIPVANFRMATNRVFKDKNGQKQEQAEFHAIVTWGRQAEIVREYVQRGRLLFVEGRLQTRSWEAPDGQKKWKTEVVAERIQLGPRSAGGTAHAAQSAAPETQRASKEQQQSVTSDIPVIEEDTPITFDDDEPKEVDPKEIPF